MPFSLVVPEDGPPVEEGDGESEESTGGAGQSVADSFVHLEASEGSPPLSTQKSETSSVLKGSGQTSPTDELETGASSDIEVISTNNGDTWSERSSRSGVLSLSTGWQLPSHGRSKDASKPDSVVLMQGIDRKL